VSALRSTALASRGIRRFSRDLDHLLSKTIVFVFFAPAERTLLLNEMDFLDNSILHSFAYEPKELGYGAVKKDPILIAFVYPSASAHSEDAKVSHLPPP